MSEMIENLESLSAEDLKEVATDGKEVTKELATNIGGVAADCIGGQGIASEVMTNFPVVRKVLANAASSAMRTRAEQNLLTTYKGTYTVGEKTLDKWMMKIPATIYTTEPADTSNECCWTPFDFDKCASEVPLNLLCLKSCEDIEDVIMSNIVRFGARDAVPGIASAGEKLATVKERVARMSMVFFSAKNFMFGIDNTYTATLKPFHGMLAVLENPAVPHIDGTNTLAAFDQLGCRLAIIGGRQWFALNPSVYNALDALIYPDERGNLPAHWSRVNGELRFMGRPFVQDKNMLVDTQAGTGEIWMIDDDTMGGFMATDLNPTDPFVRTSGDGYGDKNANCGAECMYLYNMGTAFASDANKLAVITDVPVQAGCVDAISDLAALVNPTTLIPRA